MIFSEVHTLPTVFHFRDMSMRVKHSGACALVSQKSSCMSLKFCIEHDRSPCLPSHFGVSILPAYVPLAYLHMLGTLFMRFLLCFDCID